MGYHFTTRFSVFYLGSVLAIIYHEIKDKTIFQFNIYVKFILGIITLMVYIKALKYGSSYYNKSLTEYGSFFNASFYMAIILFLMLNGSPNFFTDIFNCRLFKVAGKFSFGIYLFHPMCLIEVKKILNFQSKLIILLYALAASFLAGAVFFHLIENPLMKFANYSCKMLSNLKYFKKTNFVKFQNDVHVVTLYSE